MERLDFASVMAVLRRNIDEDMCSNQMDLLCTLFRDLIDDPFQDVELDNGQVCRWVNGLAKLSPKISGYYQENRSQRKLAKTIEQAILPMMPDPAMAVQELHDLLVQAPNVSPQMKAQLAEGLSFEDEALFIMEVLCFAMRLRFEKRDVRNRQLLTPGLCPRRWWTTSSTLVYLSPAAGSWVGIGNWNSSTNCSSIRTRCSSTASPALAKASWQRCMPSATARRTPTSSM